METLISPMDENGYVMEMESQEPSPLEPPQQPVSHDEPS